MLAIVGTAVGVACGARTNLDKPTQRVSADAGDAGDATLADSSVFDSPISNDVIVSSDVVEECLAYGEACQVWSDCCGDYCDEGHVCSPAPLYGAPPPPDSD